MEKKETNNNEQHSKWKGLFLRYIIAIVIETGLLFGYFAIVGLFQDETILAIYKHLCDGFMVVGFLAFGVGILIYFSNLGAFNFLSFAALKLASKFIQTMKISTMSYGDYIDSKKKGNAKFSYLLITGALLLIVSLIFLILFYQIYEG